MRFITLLLCSMTAYAQVGGAAGARSSDAGTPPLPHSPKPDATALKPEDLGAIEGIIRNSVTGEPLRKANVTLSRIDPGGNNTPAITSSNPEGKFSLKALEPGQYRMSIDRAGFVRSDYGARPGSVWGGGTVLTLAKGQTLANIEINLSPHSVITGRVTDDDGDPVQGASLQLLRFMFAQGKKQAVPVNYAGTDDRGEFRMFGIGPGKYYLSATARMAGPYGAVNRSGNQGPEETFTPTYYPGTLDITGAAQISVALGREVQGIDIRLRKTRTFRIKGNVVGVPQTGNRNGMVNIRSKDSAAAMLGIDRSNSPWRGPAGQFEVRGIRPGSYVIEAIGSDGADQILVGRTNVEVSERDIDNATVTLGPAIEVRGSVRLAVQAPASLSNLQVLLEPVSPGAMMGTPSARISEEGAFTIRRAMPETYYVRVHGAPPEVYLKSVRLAGTDVLEHGLDLEKMGSASGLDIVLSPGAAKVEGAVIDEKGNPVKGAVLLLRPKDLKQSTLSLLSRTFSSDQSGQFRIAGIRPGTYSLIAFQGLGGVMEAQDPELFQQHSGKAVTLDLKENDAVSKTITPVEVDRTEH